MSTTSHHLDEAVPGDVAPESMSSFTWLDYSDRDRRRALQVVDQFRESDTQDELGLGTIRDGIADRLFPGTSTVQTRVRYFLLVPWAVQRATQHGTPGGFVERNRNEQDRLRRSLEAGGESVGVIGHQAGRGVKRLPSSIYWQGLGRLGIRRSAGSEADYARLALMANRESRVAVNDDRERVDPDRGVLWDPRLPPAPKDWLQETSFALTAEERRYLTHRIEVTAPRSLFAWLIQKRAPVSDAAFMWDAVETLNPPDWLRDETLHARNFSETMHGAALLYNLMLAEASNHAPFEERYRDALGRWWATLQSRSTAIREWDRRAFWAFVRECDARVTLRTQVFVDKWLDGLTTATTVDHVASPTLRTMIKAREHSLKGVRSRLTNQRALDQWRGASGAAQLDYRWKDPVRGMVTDLGDLPAGTSNA